MTDSKHAGYALQVLHFAMTFALPLVLAFLLGCELIEKAEEDGPEAYGPEISDDKLDLAVSRAIAGYNLLAIDVGQFVEYVDVRRLESEETATMLGAVRIDVATKDLIDSTDAEDIYRFNLHITESVRMNDGSFETKYTEAPLELGFPKESSEAARLRAMTLASRENIVALATRGIENQLAEMSSSVLPADSSVALPKTTVTKVTLHNLKEQSETVEVPASVKGKPGCGGVASCQITKRYVSFDVVQWYSNGSRQKIHLDYGFSVQTPFLPYGELVTEKMAGLLVTYCRSTYVPVTGRTVFVRDCFGLEDFQK